MLHVLKYYVQLQNFGKEICYTFSNIMSISKVPKIRLLHVFERQVDNKMAKIAISDQFVTRCYTLKKRERVTKFRIIKTLVHEYKRKTCVFVTRVTHVTRYT